MRSVVAALILGGILAAQPTLEERQIQWLPTLEQAFQEAAAKNVPVLVAINYDYDPVRQPDLHEANRQVAEQYYREPVVVRATHAFACVVASASTHARSGPCPRFGAVTCAQHRAVEKAVRERYLQDERGVVAPQHLVLKADGTLIARSLLSRKPAAFVRFLSRTLARFRGVTVQNAPADPPALISALKSRDEGRRLQAFARALKLLALPKPNPALARAVQVYLSGLRSPDELRTAFQLAAAAGGEEALLLLSPLLSRRAAPVRTAVLNTWVRAKPSPRIFAAVARHLSRERSEGPTVAMVRLLERYVETQKEALPLLNRLVRSKYPRVQALATLAAARPQNRALLRLLVERVRREPNLDVRVAAILATALLQAKEVLPLLEKVRRRENRNPRLVAALDAAIQALGGLPAAATRVTDQVNRLREDLERRRDEDGRGGRRGGRSGRSGGRGGGRRG